MKPLVKILVLFYVLASSFFILFLLVSTILESCGIPIKCAQGDIMILSITLASFLTAYYGYKRGLVGRSDFRYTLESGQLGLIMCLLLLLLVPLSIFEILAPLPDMLVLNGLNFQSPAVIISAVVVAPVVEEIIFRGMITKILLAKYDPKKAILISALIFGIIHMNPAQIPCTIMLGLLFGWLFYKTRSIIPGVILHFTNNAIALLGSNYFNDDVLTNHLMVTLLVGGISVIVLLFMVKKVRAAFVVAP